MPLAVTMRTSFLPVLIRSHPRRSFLLILTSVNVFADGPGGAAGCGEHGDTVTFHVGEQLMAPTATWDDRQLWEVVLRPDDERRVYLPLAIKGR